MSAHAATFERYYRASDDPWEFRTRWYERRKRALLRAMLPRERYESAWEIGCSNGELAAELAVVCDRLLATDGNETAVRAARKRLAGTPGVTVEQSWVPERWPAETFDLIVLSEMAYYLDAASLVTCGERLAGSLRRDGHFVACHWRPPIEGCAMTGEEAHEILGRTVPWKKIGRHVEDDFVLEVWSGSGCSVAEEGGLR